MCLYIAETVDLHFVCMQEIYCHMLVRYRQELTRPIQEADEFFRSMEAQMDTLSLGEYV